MRIVVTRPENTGKKTAVLLQDMGHEAALLPLVEARHDIEATRLAMATPWASLTLTSAQALAALADTGIDLRSSAKKGVFAVGEATATAARQAGFENIQTADGYGESLARLIGEQMSASNGAIAPLLYLAGSPRSSALETALDGLGITYTTTECYRMLPIDWSKDDLDALLVAKPVDAVLLFSTETARLFFKNIISDRYEDQLRHSHFFCLSDNVAAAVPKAFSRNVHVSSLPSQAGLLDLLKSH